MCVYVHVCAYIHIYITVAERKHYNQYMLHIIHKYMQHIYIIIVVVLFSFTIVSTFTLWLAFVGYFEYQATI